MPNNEKMSIGYIETFPVPGLERWRKIPLSVEVTPDIDFLTATDEEIEAFMVKVRRVQYALKKQVQEFFFESKGHDEKLVVKEPESVGKNQDVIELINKCTTIQKPHGILAYEIMAKTDKAIRQAFDNKFKELSQQIK